jgi:hypothetical protein
MAQAVQCQTTEFLTGEYPRSMSTTGNSRECSNIIREQISEFSLSPVTDGLMPGKSPYIGHVAVDKTSKKQVQKIIHPAINVKLLPEVSQS